MFEENIFADLPDFSLYRREGCLHMDLRGLMPPGPMIAIVKLIESGEGNEGFTVRLLRDPVYLYPELAERNWRAQIMQQEEDDYILRIEKAGAV